MMKRNVWLMVTAFTVVLSPANGQEEYVGPASRTLSTVPIHLLTGGVIVLQAQLNGSPDTLHFILDTGSSGISLDSATVQRLRLTAEPSSVRVRGIAGSRNVDFVYHQRLNFPGLTVDSLHFHINDYSILSQVYGLHVDGIIGYSLFSRYIIHINYDSLHMHIRSQGTFQYPKGGHLIRPYLSTLPVHRARIKDHYTYNPLLLHDIGAGVCLMLSADFVNDSTFFRKKRKWWPKEGRGIGGKVNMWLTVASNMTIGPYRFKNVPSIIFDDAHNVTSYPYLGGIIGNDILRRFNVIYNYAEKEIHLLPNTHFKDPFDYSYTGTELLYYNDQILIGPISPNSPAESAGLQEDDVVLAVNNLFNNNFDQYKKEFQKISKRTKLIINREAKLLEITMNVRSIR